VIKERSVARYVARTKHTKGETVASMCAMGVEKVRSRGDERGTKAEIMRGM
jgi:hypothetical protein